MKQGQGVYITPFDMARLTQEMPRRLELDITSKKASHKLGYRLTRLRGRGMSFAESRGYQPGDEIRHIDWRVTARTGLAHTKTFEEERDRPVCVLLDQSASLFIGTQRCFKAYLAAELAVCFGWLACRAQDRFGGLCFGDQLQFTQVRSGRKHWSRYCEAIIDANQGWDLAQDKNAIQWPQALYALQQEIRPGTLVILISDFFNHNIQPQDLRQLRAHADILCVAVEDPIEIDPPRINGPVGFGGLQWFYRGLGQDHQLLRQQYQNRWQGLRQTCAELGVGFFTASTDKSALSHLEAILK